MAVTIGACFNLLFVTFSQGGLNVVAVALSAVKSTMKDQELPGGYRLYELLDMGINMFNKVTKGPMIDE